MTCLKFVNSRRRKSVTLVLVVGVCLLVKISLNPYFDVHAQLPSAKINMSTDVIRTEVNRRHAHIIKERPMAFSKPILGLKLRGLHANETKQTTNKMAHDAQVWAQNANAERNIAEIINSNNDIGMPVPPKSKQPKVLILAYYRSGSTLTGSFFNHNPGTFFSFEPLHALHKSISLKAPMRYFTGGVSSAPTEKDVPELSLQILQAFFSCNFERLDYKTLIGGFLRQSFSFIEFAACLRAAHFGINNMSKMRKRCLAPLVQKCLSSDAIVIKAIRARMPVAEKLLNIFPDLKIIHLQRDPRGMACSLHRGSCLGGHQDMVGRCSFMSTDIHHKSSMTKELQKRVLNIQYESITQTPLKTVQKMFNFTNISSHQDVLLWTFKTMLSATHVNGSMSLQKANPLATAYKWTSRINWNVVQKCQEVCHDAIVENNYPRFSNIEEVRSYKLPITNRTEQKLELENLLIMNVAASTKSPL